MNSWCFRLGRTNWPFWPSRDGKIVSLRRTPVTRYRCVPYLLHSPQTENLSRLVTYSEYKKGTRNDPNMDLSLTKKSKDLHLTLNENVNLSVPFRRSQTSFDPLNAYCSEETTAVVSETNWLRRLITQETTHTERESNDSWEGAPP